MNVIRYLVPMLLVLYFLARAWKQRIFLLGIPFLMYMLYSIFFEKLKFFYIPGRLDHNTHMLAWVFISWIWITGKLSNHPLSEPEEAPPWFARKLTFLDWGVLSVGVIILINIGLSLLQFQDLGATYDEALPAIAMVIGFFLLKDIFAHTPRASAIAFFDSIVLVNTLAAVLYILHQGLRMPIYDWPETRSVFMGTTITRTFWFMPLFMPLSVVWYLAKDRLSIVGFVVVLINAAGILITYTRSMAIITVGLMLLLALLNGIRQRKFSYVLKRLSSFAAVAVAAFMIMSLAFPVKTAYFVERLSGLGHGLSSERDNSLLVRHYYAVEILDRMEYEDFMLGAGFVNEEQSPLTFYMQQTVADSVWTGVIFRFGIIGTVLFLLMYLFGMLKGFRLFLTTEGEAGFLARALLLIVIGFFLESFVSWTFMAPDRYSIALWYFALMSVEINRRTYELLSDEEDEEEEEDAEEGSGEPENSGNPQEEYPTA